MGKEIDEFQKAMQELMKAKLPISRTVVDRLTKLGYAAMTHYKHVVIIVEKFIQKCKPAYKLPGLYVIDALVRFNIKQRGRKADFLGPRFIKNFTTTFENIVKCPSKDFPKIIRVLNLWQAGKVYSCDVIQPLLDIITKAVGEKDLSRSPSVCGPSTPPHDDLENSESTQGVDNLDSDNFPKTPPLPEPEDSVSVRLQSLLACNRPSSLEKPLNQSHSTETDHRVSGGGENLRYGNSMPSTSDNIRKLGEFLNGSTDETQKDTSGALTTANSAEFLELLKTVNSEFSKEFLPGSSEKSQDEGDLDDHHLKSDLENEILGESNDMFAAAKTSPVLVFLSPDKASSQTDPTSGDKKDHHGSSTQAKVESCSSSRKRKLSTDLSLTEKLNKLNETLKNEMECEKKKNRFSTEKSSASKHESRNYRKRDSSPVPNLLSSISSGADLSSDDAESSRNRRKSWGKASKSKSKKMKKHETREKSNKKKSKKKKKKDKKSKKSKHASSSDDEETAKSVSTSEMPTRSLKDEMESNLKKSKSRKSDHFDLKRALESDPSVNYGPKDYPKKCMIVFSTVLSISNITDLSFKRMNDLLKNFGTVLSVEMVVSVNKALVSYSERKSACAALVSLRAQNEFGISWAFPKPVSKPPWIEMWDGAVGCCVVPWEKAPSDLAIFSEGCFIDQSTVPSAEFTKPNEVTSSTDNCTSEENQKIKKKIAEMIAKSEKTAASAETTPSSAADNKKCV